MNTPYRTRLPGTSLDYFDARAAVNDIAPGAWDSLPYTSRVLAENLVRRCDPATLTASLTQLIERKRDLDFPWYPARVVCHDILGQTALVDLAGLRDAIADQGGDPAQVNPVVPVQLIVDHSLAVECGGFDPQAFEKNRAIEDRRNEDRFHFIDWTRLAFKNVDVISPGNGIMHQINLEKMSPVIQVRDGVAFPDTCVGTDSHTPHVDALGVIAIGVGGLEAENVMLGRASWMRLPDIIGVELTGTPGPSILATDVVLALTEFLRKQKVVGAYLEFRGEGAAALSLGDRATISNMAPEYGATAAMAPGVGELAVDVDPEAPLVVQRGEGVVVGEEFELADEMLAFGDVMHLHDQGPLAVACQLMALGHRDQPPGAMAIGVLEALLEAAGFHFAAAEARDQVFEEGDIVAVHQVREGEAAQVLLGSAGEESHRPVCRQDRA